MTIATRTSVRRTAGSSLLVLFVLTSTLIVGLAPGALADGGVNTGQPGSTCAAVASSTGYTLPGPGISTTALGSAPAYYELGAPNQAYLNQAPKGLMMIIHGGGWYTVGLGPVAAERSEADLWRGRGWETLNITYRACAQSLGDVLWFHDAIRSLIGPNLPLCAWGGSAGAHLALMTASLRPDVACVIGEGAPTDLLTLSAETAYNPVTGQSDQTSGPVWGYNLAVAAFGVGQMGAVSPALLPSHARLLLATAAQDEFIPWAQAQDMATAVSAAHPGTYVDTDQLPAGNVAFTHVSSSQGTGVSQAAYDDYLVRQLRLVAPLVAPPGVTNPVINDIRVPGMGNWADGTEEFDATVLPTKTQAHVSGRTAFGPGSLFKLMSCAGYYDPVRPAQGSCSTTYVDTRGAAGTTSVAIPTVSTTWARPASGTGSGWGYGVVYVWYLDGTGQWASIASSSPDNAADAGTTIPALGS